MTSKWNDRGGLRTTCSIHYKGHLFIRDKERSLLHLRNTSLEVYSANLALFLIKDTTCRSRRSCTALRVKAIVSAGGHGTKDSKTLSEPNEEVAVSSDGFYAYLLLPLLLQSSSKAMLIAPLEAVLIPVMMMVAMAMARTAGADGAQPLPTALARFS